MDWKDERCLDQSSVLGRLHTGIQEQSGNNSNYEIESGSENSIQSELK
jgi:hypothetical protein